MSRISDRTIRRARKPERFQPFNFTKDVRSAFEELTIRKPSKYKPTPLSHKNQKK